MHGILRLPTDPYVTTVSPPPSSTQPVRRVAFHTDRASKPISKIELRGRLKGEWSIFKRQLGTRVRYPSVTRKTRLSTLFLGKPDPSLERLLADAGSKLGGGWGYFTRNIVHTRPRPRIPSKPRQIYPVKATHLAPRRSLKRKPKFAELSIATRLSAHQTDRSKVHLKSYGGKDRRVIRRTKAIQRD
ncbi:hypothetical protein C8R44DRAFT_889843 [Mycena epipterygia]|nr:hypothetical protein C8R44DRAFT_889843 [Mycena epipterygia]